MTLIEEQASEIERLEIERNALRAERDALLARLAPVDDDALVEIVADAILLFIFESPDNRFDHRGQARNAIAAIRPHIEAAERERCAEEIDEYRRRYGGNWPALITLAAEIRSRKCAKKHGVGHRGKNNQIGLRRLT